MKHPGKIVIIANKVKFEYYELEKPDKKTYNKAKLYNFENLIIQKYEASKQLIEVNNVTWKRKGIKWIKTQQDSNHYAFEKYTNGQSCEAEVENNVAVIIKIS